MRDLGGADAKRISAEGAVRGGVAVTADDQQARQSEALFGANDMDNALPWIVQTEQGDAAFRRIRFEIAHHGGDLGIGDAGGAPVCRHVMVGDAERERRLGDAAPARFHLAEGVKRALMHKMPVDPEQRGAILAARDLMRRP